MSLWLGKLFPSAFYPQSKLVALEMIQMIAEHLPFQVRLNLILPLVQAAFSTTGTDDVQANVHVKCSSTPKIKARALGVMIGLFHELEHSNTAELTIEPLDYKVASSYLIPCIKNQLESNKNDQLIKLVIAQNLGRLTRLSVKFLEISITSAIRRCKELKERREDQQ